MNYQRIAIRILVVSLCIAAFSGVAALLLPSSSYLIGKLIGTAFATAATAALLLLSIKVLENSQYKLVGMAIALIVCFVYLTGIGAMWTDGIFFFEQLDIPEKLAVTSLLSEGCGILIVIGASMQSKTPLKLAGLIFMILWLVALCSWLITTWVFNFNTPISEKVIYILVPLQNFSAPLAIIFIRQCTRYRVTGVLVTAIACLSVQIGLLSTGGKIQEIPLLFYIALCSGWLSGIIAIWVVLTLRKEKSALILAERGTAVLVGVALAIFCVLIWYDVLGDKLEPPDLLNRLGASSGILASTAVLSLLIGQMIRANFFLRQSRGNLKATCPRCNEQIIIPQGKSNCQNCGLCMKLQMESPNCRTCNYDLSGRVNSDLCPECGEPIASN